MEDFVEIGGVKFKFNAVLFQAETDGKYEVVLENGTKILFEEQSEDREAMVDMSYTNRVDFNGLVGATIMDTPENDIYRLLGCENVTVEANRGYNSDQDMVEVCNRLLPNGKEQLSRNNVVKLNAGDLFKLPQDDMVQFVQDDCTHIEG